MTLFQQCVEAADQTDLVDGLPDYTAITRSVLECLRDNTDEVVRVLGEAPAGAVYVA